MSEGLSRIESNVLNHDKLLGLLATAEVKPKEEPIVAPVVSLPLPQKKVEIGNHLVSDLNTHHL